MIKFKKSMLFAVVFSLFFVFSSQAQVDDTTYIDTPSGIDTPSETEFGTPQSETEMQNQQTRMGTDTTGKYAAHFRLAEEMAERLSQTITVSEEQKNDITRRIIEFQEEVAEVNMEMKEEGVSADTQDDLDEELVELVDDIESMLDDNQRAEWIRAKNDWMNEVKAHIESNRDIERQNRQDFR